MDITLKVGTEQIMLTNLFQAIRVISTKGLSTSEDADKISFKKMSSDLESLGESRIYKNGIRVGTITKEA